MTTRPVRLPRCELIVGSVWWVVGATALRPGTATVVLALGMLVAGTLLLALRRRGVHGERLDRRERSRLLSVTFVAVMLVVVTTTVLRMLPAPFDYAELSVPLAGLIVGIAVIRVGRLLSAPVTTLAGCGVCAIAVLGGLIALQTAGDTYSSGLVGLGSAIVLWAAGAYRTGVLSRPAPGPDHPTVPTRRLD
ncbi:hypothetical protein [Pseudonocardia sp.]|uniref:hypothetical protein n=1 Tax=Pseudonocardia sp. TaxID=60912 RepID=UPI003D0D53E4